MSREPESRWCWRPWAVFAAAVLFGAAMGTVMAVLVAAGAPGTDSFARFIWYSLALAIPTGALIGGCSAGIGLVLRRVLPTESRTHSVVTSVVAGAAAFVVAAGFSVVIAPTIELAEFAWVPVAGSLVGGVALTLWSLARAARGKR